MFGGYHFILYKSVALAKFLLVPFLWMFSGYSTLFYEFSVNFLLGALLPGGRAAF